MKTLNWILHELRWQKAHSEVCSLPRLIWSMLWWPDEDTPRWWTRTVFVARRVWYVGRSQLCVCEGCTHRFPAWWSTNLCSCCGVEADCCHGEDA